MPDDEHVKPPAMADQSDETLKAVIAGGFFCGKRRMEHDPADAEHPSFRSNTEKNNTDA